MYAIEEGMEANVTCTCPPRVTKGLAKTIRAMADGTLDSQVGARICNGLGIMRAGLTTFSAPIVNR